jgi:hypothetical protein
MEIYREASLAHFPKYQESFGRGQLVEDARQVDREFAEYDLLDDELAAVADEDVLGVDGDVFIKA